MFLFAPGLMNKLDESGGGKALLDIFLIIFSFYLQVHFPTEIQVLLQTPLKEFFFIGK